MPISQKTVQVGSFTAKSENGDDYSVIIYEDQVDIPSRGSQSRRYMKTAGGDKVVSQSPAQDGRDRFLVWTSGTYIVHESGDLP